MPDANAAGVVHGTVADIPDLELLRRAARGRTIKGRYGGYPRWAMVADRFLLGSTYSNQLCRRLGLDPDERVRRAP